MIAKKMSKKMFIESKQMVKVEKCFTPSCYHRITMQLRKLSQEHWEIKQLVKNMSSKNENVEMDEYNALHEIKQVHL